MSGCFSTGTSSKICMLQKERQRTAAAVSRGSRVSELLLVVAMVVVQRLHLLAFMSGGAQTSHPCHEWRWLSHG